MRAFFAKAPMRFEMREVELRPLAPDEALVRVRACGVCGWDVIVARTVARDWSPIGHEIAGTVEALGSAVRGFQVGDPVVVENSTFCGVCAQCKRGNVVHCTSLDGHRSPGGFADFIIVRYTGLYPLGALSFRAGALAEPLTVAIDMVEAAEIPLSGHVAVFGPGPIGLMIARLALAKGAARVYLTGHAHSGARWEAAHRLGVTECIAVDETDLVSYIAEREPKGLDRVLVTSPPDTIPAAVELCRFGGIVVYDGIKFGSGGTIQLDGNAFHFKRLQLRGVHSVPNLGWPQALDLLERRVIDPELFISHVFPFERVPDAVRFAERARGEAVKVMVEMEEAD
ncbi:MAG: alcohol dehydrogenase catalytic domain-containing protein [Anaerolineales bacterium]|nr:alcohol dehydrogenase catalytic domain-containing protein [Anaerolineales bacterium]